MREESLQKIEVHVAGICFDGDKVLVLKRSDSRKIYPNLWECGGGQVNLGENFEEAIKRQLEEEAGIIVDVIKVSGTYEIATTDLEQKKIPGIKFACKFIEYKNGDEPQISEEHTEWRWIAMAKLDDIEFIPRIREDIEAAYNIMKAI